MWSGQSTCHIVTICHSVYQGMSQTCVTLSLAFTLICQHFKSYELILQREDYSISLKYQKLAILVL